MPHKKAKYSERQVAEAITKGESFSLEGRPHFVGHRAANKAVEIASHYDELRALVDKSGVKGSTPETECALLHNNQVVRPGCAVHGCRHGEMGPLWGAGQHTARSLLNDEALVGLRNRTSCRPRGGISTVTSNPEST